MKATTNPLQQGVAAGSLQEAQARLLEPLDKEEALDTDEPEQEGPEEETLEAAETDEGLEPEEEVDEEGIEPSEQSDVGDVDETDSHEQEDEEPYHTIKYDGAEYEVTLGELKKGYQLQKDYTQKTQSLSEERKEVDTLKASLDQERQKYIAINQELLNQQQQTLKSFETVDWAELKAADPMAYMEKLADKQHAEQEYVAQQQRAQAALTEQQVESTQRMNAYLTEQAEVLTKALPEYGDPEKGQGFRDSITLYAQQSGYSEVEIQSIASARDLIILNKARMFDDLQQKKETVRKKKTGEKPSVRIKASSPVGKTTKRSKVIEAKKDRLRSSGKQRDAEALMLELFKSSK